MIPDDDGEANRKKWISKAQEWIKWDPNPTTSAYLESLVSARDVDGIKSALGSRLTFGTAGLRAKMGAGSNCINDLTVIQTTQGLCAYLINTHGLEAVQSAGIVIGYDHRGIHTSTLELSSKSFATAASAVFASKNIPVYLFSSVVPTPFVPFALELKSAIAGIMITASHNPKDDNGYKLYGQNGCQIISPVDDDISSCIDENLAPWQSNYTECSLLSSDPLKDVCAAYFATLKTKLCQFPQSNKESPIRVVYTAMHGVGSTFAVEAFKAFDHVPFIPVEAQASPDPLFPTVKFPNPEEGDGALALAYETAAKNNCSLVLANDPDADRLAVAEKLPSGQWKVFSGNEIGVMLGHWEWTKYCEEEKESGSASTKSDVYIVASTVSSKMLRAIGEKEGFKFEETLTGFKWMGNKVAELRSRGNVVLMAFEEAIGFCLGNVLKDKDGISAAAVFLEMANQVLKRSGMSVNEHLESLYKNYGYYITSNHYVKCYDPNVTARIFARLRNDGSYWNTLGESYDITSIRDQTTGYDSSTSDLKSSLPMTPSVNMITYTFANGCVATLRTSGTEPKIKYYVEYKCDYAKKDDASAKLEEFVKVLVEEMLQPNINGLE